MAERDSMKRKLEKASAIAVAYNDDNDDGTFQDLVEDALSNENDADEVLTLAIPLAVGDRTDLVASEFIQAVLDVAGMTIFTKEDDDTFYCGSLFAVPFHGDPKLVVEFMDSDGFLKFGHSLVDNGMAGRNSQVQMIPLPIVPLDAVQITPNWLRAVTETVAAGILYDGDAALPKIKTSFERDGTGFGDWKVGTHWLILGVEVQAISSEADERIFTLTEQNDPALIASWHTEAMTLVPKGLHFQRPDTLSRSKTVLAAAKASIDLDAEAALRDLKVADVYDDLILVPDNARLLVSALIGTEKVGPVSVAAPLALADHRLLIDLFRQLARRVSRLDDFQADVVH